MHDLSRSIRILIPALLGMALATTAVRANIIGFGNFSNFTINQGDTFSAPVVSVAAGSIHLTSANSGESRSIFANAIQPTTHFTASFTYQNVTGNPFVGGFFPGAEFAFVLENDTRGPAAIGVGLGYTGIKLSDAVEFTPGSTISYFTGLFTNGNTGASNNLTPVNLASTDPMNVVIGYDGSLVTETVTDTITAGTSSFTYLKPAGFPTSAYVGITAGTDNGSFSVAGPIDQLFSNFQFSTTSVPEPSSLALLGMGAGALCFACRRRKKRALANDGESTGSAAT